MSSGYRDAVSCCQLCRAATAPPILTRVGGHDLCPGCRAGELGQVERRWGLEVKGRVVSLGGTERAYSLVVEVTRPSRSAVLARVEQAPESLFDLLRRMFRRGGRRGLDPEQASFADSVRVLPDEGHEEATAALLEREEVRRALLELICMGCAVELYPNSLWARAECRCHPPVLPDQDAVTLRMVCVAVAVEQLCRG